ncbi:hypothetical protein ACTJJE_11680 [Mycolicibacterium sp. 22603]
MELGFSDGNGEWQTTWDEQWGCGREVRASLAGTAALDQHECW